MAGRRRLPLCGGCKQRIAGRAVTGQGSAWHPEHFICAGCSRAIAERDYREIGGRAFHQSCSGTADARCELCGNALTHDYLIDHWNTRFCRDHLDKYPRCRFCQRLVPPRLARGKTDSDVRCTICEISAVRDMRAAQPLFQAVVRWIGTLGLRFNNLDLRVDLCGEPALLQYQQEVRHGATLGVTLRTMGVGGRRGGYAGVDRVLILQRLPPVLFQGVSAHELGHAWLVVHNVQSLAPSQEEGFCELLAHGFYGDHTSPEAAYYAKCIEQNLDSVYGAGFRDVQVLAQRQGFAAIVQSLATLKQMPLKSGA